MVTMNMSFKKTRLFFLLLSVSLYAVAQKEERKWQVGINGGLMIYQGDLTPSPLGSYKTATPSAGFYISRILNSYFAVRANAAFGTLKGDEAKYSSPSWRKLRGLNFSTPLTEISGLLVWNPFGNNNNEIGLRFTPYLMGGAGVSFLNISRDYSKMDSVAFPASSKQRQGLGLDSIHSLPRSLLVLPIGAGVSYYLTPKFSLTFETMFRYTFTDYLDGFSHAADPNQKDFYHSHTLGVVYRFGKKNQLDCPPMKY
jgi:opacity protein-like surface antigen